MQASGLSLGRISTPFIGLGLLLMVLSLLLYGFVQPYSRFAYRMVLHAAENAGWSGQVKAKAIFAPDRTLILTAEGADPTGEILDRVFIRRLSPTGQEDVLTASSAEIHRNRDGRSASLVLKDGQQLSNHPGVSPRLLTFTSLTIRLPLVPPARLLRSRGSGEETELTLLELAERGYGDGAPVLPRQTLLAELYSRLVRALALPLMPLLAVPFGLTAKRVESRAAFIVAGVLLFLFQIGVLFGQGLAEKGVLTAAVALGVPFAVFMAIAMLTFVSSQRSPGENPVNRLTEWVSDRLQILAHKRTP
jgi:lipopolysaccharide export system permease protein